MLLQKHVFKKVMKKIGLKQVRGIYNDDRGDQYKQFGVFMQEMMEMLFPFLPEGEDIAAILFHYS